MAAAREPEREPLRGRLRWRTEAREPGRVPQWGHCRRYTEGPGCWGKPQRERPRWHTEALGSLARPQPGCCRRCAEDRKTWTLETWAQETLGNLETWAQEMLGTLETWAQETLGTLETWALAARETAVEARETAVVVDSVEATHQAGLLSLSPPTAATLSRWRRWLWRRGRWRRRRWRRRLWQEELRVGPGSRWLEGRPLKQGTGVTYFPGFVDGSEQIQALLQDRPDSGQAGEDLVCPLLNHVAGRI
ncbi:uncharacterized protein LOC117152652 [Mastacembelus armatus]|uniref:uncharacterized protein LOC117152652 n=1 Tax=Mastacembelus armatus TaxID=205130 RepID=UPI001436987C|nr:uncharacterized protein LOC117152652 [Mastacembelus armatus]